MSKRAKTSIILFCCLQIISCTKQSRTSPDSDNPPVATRLTEAKASDGQYISWKEHLIDGSDIGGVDLSGSDGLTMGDLDKDGFEDFVSVHESDTVYDGKPQGFIRIAFGSKDPDVWDLVTLAAGTEAAAAEDVDIGDLNGDGWPDVIGACELSHLIYFQNPGKNIRTAKWDRVIPAITENRGSYIRAFFADFNGDGKLEVTSPNKGSQNPGLHTNHPTPISWYEIKGNPLNGNSWIEHELTRVDIPENSRPVDLDGDGDLDIFGGSRGEERAMWFENEGTNPITFKEHAIHILNGNEPYPITAVNVDFHDLNKDGRLDIVVFQSPHKKNFGWIEQPKDHSDPWKFHFIGTTQTDTLIGLVLADINQDGNLDIMTGTYSGSPRDHDGETRTVNDGLGRIAWFEHPGDPYKEWIRHDISRRIRGMFDKFVAIDLDKDGDLDFVSTRGNSYPYDGVFWLEQVRTKKPTARFVRARKTESQEVGLPTVEK